MPQVIEFGTITYFNPAKRYGFIRSDNGQKIFFHLSGSSGPRVVESMYCGFSREVYMDAFMKLTPELGVRMAFRVVKSDKGLNAITWTFEEIWQAAMAEPRFLVVRRRVIQGQQNAPETLFRGTLTELEEQFPWSEHSDVLAPIVASSLRSTCSFFIFRNGRPQPCSDPRKQPYRIRPSIPRVGALG